MSQPTSADIKVRAKHQFEAWSDSYDRSVLNRFMFRPAYVTAMEEIARWCDEHRRSFRVLDIGCGTGTLAGWLTASPWPVRVVGMDYAEGMCRAASAKAGAKARHFSFSANPEDRGQPGGSSTCPQPRLPVEEKVGCPVFVCADSEHLPFADASFDVVTCSNSFHHYPHQQAVVNEMRRVLRPHGRLILIDGFRDIIVGWVTFDVIIARVEGRVHHAPWTVVRDYFKAAGFTGIRRRKLNFWFPLLATIGDAK